MVFYHFEMIIKYLRRILKCLHSESLIGVEVLHALAGGVHDLTSQLNVNVFEIGRHLE